ncbi:MAG: hypothetical protein ACREAC_07940, partial [Blastocatellia bacterium]
VEPVAWTNSALLCAAPDRLRWPANRITTDAGLRAPKRCRIHYGPLDTKYLSREARSRRSETPLTFNRIELRQILTMEHLLLASLALLVAGISYQLGRAKGRTEVRENASFWEQVAQQKASVAEYWKLSAKDWERMAAAAGHLGCEAVDQETFVEICQLERMYGIR